MPTDDFEALYQKYHKLYEERNAAREQALALCRQTTRQAANAIRAIHRLEFDEAARLVEEAKRSAQMAGAGLKEHPDVFYAGFIHDAQKEYVEASVTLGLITRSVMPNQEELAVEDAAYLNGLGEAVGELRRHILDRLRHNQLDECERLLGYMDEIYNLLVTIDYPEAMTHGLRRTTDAARGVLERTRADFTTAVLQSQLDERLRQVAGH